MGISDHNIGLATYLLAMPGEAIPDVLSDITATTNTNHQIVFIDMGVTGYQALAESIDGDVEIYFLDGESNGLDQIPAVLYASDYEYSDINIISHGSVGEVQLGSETLSSDTLEANRDSLEAIGSNLTTDGDIY